MRILKSNKSKKPVIPFLVFPVMLFLIFLLSLASCSTGQTQPDENSGNANLPEVLAVESFLADITKNIVGTRLEVETLMPLGMDPHSFEPTPGDVVKIAESDILIINGAGFEEWLGETITGANEDIKIVESSKGLEGDPHFWLDPNLVKVYVQNIRDALIESDPQGKDLYTKNAGEYISRLEELDRWIVGEVEKIPIDKRLLVTNHESLGYYADRYGFTVIGSIIPGSSSAAAPSAKDISELIERIKAAGVKAIFLETGSDPKIASQLAGETGIKIVTEIYTHSITAPDGPAPTYIDMIRFNTSKIVEALK